MIGEKLEDFLIGILNVLSVLILSLLLAAFGFGISFTIYQITTTFPLGMGGWLYLPFAVLAAMNGVHIGILLGLGKLKFKWIVVLLLMSYMIGFLGFVYSKIGNIEDALMVYLLFLCLLYAGAFISSRKLQTAVR